MNKLSRRGLLKGALAGGALAGASAIWPRLGNANGPIAASLSTGQTYNVLEIFLDGGADFWDHAYQADWAQNATRHGAPGLLHFMHQSPTNDWLPIFAGVSDLGMVPWAPDEQIPFGTSDGGEDVSWGPGFKPLAPYLDNARMVAIHHEFPFHEGAAHLAVTGTSLGRPAASSLGAAVNRARSPGEAPVSFTLVVGQPTGANTLPAAMATGFHGAANRPVLIPIGNTTLHGQLDRGTPPPFSAVARADGDPLRGHYQSRYRSMLVHGGSRARSRAFDAYEGSIATLSQHAGLQQRLAGVSFAIPSTDDVAHNPTATAIDAAAGLIQNGARNVLVVDSYWDTHDGSFYTDANAYARYLVSKTFRVTHAIAAAIARGALQLRQTLVFIHSEFGRRVSLPSAQNPNPNGSEHNPEGYPVLLLGGPITSRAIAGHITGPAAPGGASVADGRYGVADVRAAVALAAGIDPWHAHMYAESTDWLGSRFHDDVLSHGDPLSAGTRPILEQAIFGIP